MLVRLFQGFPLQYCRVVIVVVVALILHFPCLFFAHWLSSLPSLQNTTNFCDASSTSAPKIHLFYTRRDPRQPHSFIFPLDFPGKGKTWFLAHLFTFQLCFIVFVGTPEDPLLCDRLCTTEAAQRFLQAFVQFVLKGVFTVVALLATMSWQVVCW